MWHSWGHNRQACDLQERHICLEDHESTWLYECINEYYMSAYMTIKLLHKIWFDSIATIPDVSRAMFAAISGVSGAVFAANILPFLLW